MLSAFAPTQIKLTRRFSFSRVFQSVVKKLDVFVIVLMKESLFMTLGEFTNGRRKDVYFNVPVEVTISALDGGIGYAP